MSHYNGEVDANFARISPILQRTQCAGEHRDGISTACFHRYPDILKKLRDVRSVLLVKTSSLGDVIHNLPVVSDLRAQWPQVTIDWVVEENFVDIVRLHPEVGQIFPVAIRRWRKTLLRRSTWREIRNFRTTLQQRTYDIVIDTQGLLKSAWITLLADGLRCGFDRMTAREPLAALAYHQTYAIPRPIHAVTRNRWLVAAACDGSQELKLRYGIRASHPLPLWCPRQQYVVLLTATSRDDKLWSDTAWMKLGQMLFEKGYVSVLPAGSAREQARAQTLAQNIPGAIAPPPCSLTELASILQNATAAAGVDTGLTHLAAALGCPIAAIYVVTDPSLTGVHAATPAINLGTIGAPPSAESVFDALTPYL